MITETEIKILQALLDLDAAVESMPTASPKPNLLPLFTRLDDLTETLPTRTDTELLHYLRKRSYEKARLWLEDRKTEIARGGCRHD